MVSASAKWALMFTKEDPLDIARITGSNEQECWEFLDDLNIELNLIAKDCDESVIRQQAKDWANSLPEAYECRRLILLERLKEAKTDIEKKERLTHYKLFTNKLQTLPPEQIERARNYPIEQLLGTTKKITNCPFHDDRTASLNIKNNFYHCHGCGVSGDSISFVMKKEGISFREAVLKLT